MCGDKPKGKSQKAKVMNNYLNPQGESGKGRQSFLKFAFCLLPFAFLLSGCRQDMHDNPKFKPNRDGANRQIPQGAIARGALDLAVAAPAISRPAPGQQFAQTDTGPIPNGEDGFPFRLSSDPATRKKELKEILDRGENRFNITCLPCHGKLGDGTGMIALRGFRRPPTYHQDRLRKAPTSHFYDVISNGFGAMPNYTDQLTPEDRWKVIAYIRVLQQSQYALAADLSNADRDKVEKAGPAPKPPAGVMQQAAPQSTSAPAPQGATQPSGGHSN
jgi:mono/diheme cytochrome c family protein